ncbi:MAG TPA: response regulator transcription factor [Thermoanaerobaculia bacterium]|nr:response regulator transcription factor [Thermoanaerobaculia bacterium]
MPIRVVVADDHPIVLEGLSQLFSADREFQLAERCSNGDEALAAVARHKPDVLVLDVRMPGLDGLGVLRELAARKSATRVVLLTAEINDNEMLEAIRLGACAIVMKETASQNLLRAARAASRGEQTLDDRLVRRALDHLLRREAGVAKARSVLTSREIDIVQMVARGLRNRQIGEALSISEGTVKIHLHSIYSKLGISGRVELTLYARENALA